MSEKSGIKSVEVDGVSFEYDENMLDDMRTVIAIGSVSDGSLPESEKLVWFSRLSELLFIDPWGVMSRLAETHGGHVSPDDYNAFFSKALEAMNAKN